MKTFEASFNSKIKAELKNEPALTIHTTHGQYIGSIDKFGEINIAGNFRFINPQTKFMKGYSNRVIKIQEGNKITIG